MTDTRSTPVSNEAAADRHARRRARTEQAILDAANELIAAGGLEGLTIEGVAARSGVAKTTIYRRYRDKGELALAIILGWLEAPSPPRDLGDTRKELVRFANLAVKVLSSPLYRDVVHGLVTELRKPELARAYRERVVAAWLADLQTIIDRGVERGDLRPDTDTRHAQELIVGPIYYRLLFSGAPVDRKLGALGADAVMRTYAAAPDED
jgi:AcrR family transcriptional regulator